jgi:thiol-disulfide isomerase/thioredoxin
MKKFVSIALGLLIVGGIGYYFYSNSPAPTPHYVEFDDEGMVESEDAIMNEEAMIQSEDATADEAMMQEEDTMNSEDAMGKQTGPVYTAYSEGVIGNGQMSVLFFHAPWCPDCKKADNELTEIYSAGSAVVATYKVDYDSQTDLKTRYGVTNQHTFVVIDGQGNAVRLITGATKDQLKALVL